MQQAIETAATKASPEDWGAMIGLVIREYNAGNFDSATAHKLQREAISGAFSAACERNTPSEVFVMVEAITAKASDTEPFATMNALVDAKYTAINEFGFAGSLYRPDYHDTATFATSIAGALYQCGADEALTDLAHELTKLAYWK